MNNKSLFIGILSGTSMDSIDCGIFNFSGHQQETIDFCENDFPKNLKREIKKEYANLIMEPKKHYLNKEISLLFSKYIKKILAKNKIEIEKINSIGMHGQTISHGKKDGKNFSIQIGCPKTLSMNTQINVVSDFRQTDIDNGGEGAPLAPLYHEFLFKNDSINRGILNIGGIANISLIPSGNSKTWGCDIGPGNTLIDTWVKKRFQREFDKDGNLAKQYKCNLDFLTILLSDDIFKSNNSMSIEYFSYEWLKKKIDIYNSKLAPKLSDGQILATLTEMLPHLFKMHNILKEKIFNIDELLICGGGAFNKTLVLNLQKTFDFEVNTTEVVDINPKIIESGLFAWLASCKVMNIALDYQNITGSKNPKATLGNIYESM